LNFGTWSWTSVFEAFKELLECFDLNEKLIASQLPVSTWYEVIGEGTIADAILDRLVQGAHRISLSGESLRKVKK
jgi:DNA replication protein DnaC